LSDLLIISPGGRRKRPDLGPMDAAERYDGPHHRWVMAGVQRLRAAGVGVALRFLSPAHGLVAEAEELLEYDLSLDAMGAARAASHLGALGLPAALDKAISGAPLTLLLLPGKYLRPLRALAARLSPPPGGRIIAFVAPAAVGNALLNGPAITMLPCAPSLTATFRVPNTALKGRLCAALAAGIAIDSGPALASLRADPTPETAWRLIEAGR
jgi:hypothetical protein